MDDARTHGAEDCCADCARARAARQETPCDRARRRGVPAPCDAGTCALPPRSASSVCTACGGRLTGCLACGPHAPQPDVAADGSSRARWLAGLSGAAGVRGRRALARRTGAINLSLPPVGAAATSAAVAAWSAARPGETAAETAARVRAYEQTAQQPGETAAAWAARVAAYDVRAPALEREWIDDMRGLGALPSAPRADDAPSTHSAGRATTPASSGASGGAPANPTQADWLRFGASLLTTAAGTTLALIAGARESDRAARADAAAAEAARLARADDAAGRAAVGAEAAENAYQKARTAALLLPDRAAATAKLSEAQGHLAGAQAARGWFAAAGARVVPPALAAAIARAAAEVDRVAALIERSDAPPPAPSASNPPAPEPPPPTRAGVTLGRAAGTAGLTAGAVGALWWLFGGRGR